MYIVFQKKAAEDFYRWAIDSSLTMIQVRPEHECKVNTHYLKHPTHDIVYLVRNVSVTKREEYIILYVWTTNEDAALLIKLTFDLYYDNFREFFVSVP